MHGANNTADDEELPPWLGERFRDVTLHILRAPFEDATTAKETHDD